MSRLSEILNRFEQRYSYRIPVAIALVCLLIIGIGWWGVAQDEEAEEIVEEPAAVDLPDADETPTPDASEGDPEADAGGEAEVEESEPADEPAEEEAAEPEPDDDPGGEGDTAAPPPEEEEPPEQDPGACPEGLDAGGCTGVTDQTIRLGIHTAESECGVPLPDTSDEDEADADTWVDYINEIEGGLHGRLIEYYEADDGYCPSMAGEAARELIDEHRVFSVQGYLGVDQNRTVAEHADARGVPYLSGGGPRDWAERWSIFYQSQSSYELMYEQVLRYIVSPDGLDMPDANIGMMYADTPDVEEPTFRSFDRVPEANVVESIPIEGIQQDFSSEISQMRASDVDVVYCNCHPLNTVSFVNQADAQLWHPQYTFVSQGHDLDIILRLFSDESTWKKNAEGLSNFCHQSHPCHEPYVEKLRQVNPDAEVSQVSLVGIHAIEMWAEPIRRVGPELNRERYMEELGGLDGWTTGLTGGMHYEPNRSVGATGFAKYVSPGEGADEYEMVSVNGEAYGRF